MSDPLVRCRHLAVATQIVIALAGWAVLALTPPAHGAMLLLPLTHGARVAVLAREHEALLLAAAPHGLIVEGDRVTLFWPMLRAGVLTLAAPAVYCGGRR